jgi:hypothetical protein
LPNIHLALERMAEFLVKQGESVARL